MTPPACRPGLTGEGSDGRIISGVGAGLAPGRWQAGRCEVKHVIALIVAAVILVGVIAGCFNVKVPEGPYVDLSEGGSSASQKPPDVEQFEEFLEDAMDDGVITKNQYKELRKRLDKKYGR